MDITNFPLFAIAVIALHATPGPDTAYVVGRTLAQGRLAGLISALGICAGCLVHTLASTFGFTALIAAMPNAFDAIRIIGACYLAYQGLKLILTKIPASVQDGQLPDAQSTGSLFVQAFLTNVLNPKVILFYLAFFPQFVAPDGQHKAIAYLLLGLYFAITAGLWASGIAWFTGTLRGRMKLGRSNKRFINGVVGAAFMGLGARLLLLSQ